MTDEELKDKRVVVLGFGRQGKALARWLPQQGAQVTISDRRDAGEMADDFIEFLMEPISFSVGGHPVELLDDADVLCLSGGIPTDLPIVKEAYARGIRVTNDAILFLERCPALVIGITGSAGKTTTTTLLGKMCEAAGRKTWVGGNIGNVLLDDLENIQADDTVVMELSSFQLEIATISPDIAAVLNITPNHLDRHGSLQDYAAAKANIFLHQGAGDIVILGEDDPVASSVRELATGQVAAFSVRRMVSDGAFLLGRRLAVAGRCSPTGMAKVVCERDEIRLRGEHNLSNVLAACAIAGAAGISVEAMRDAILGFTGVAHRLELVTELDGVQWYNDSIATAPERVIAALRSFEEPLVLLVGGRDKKLPWAELAGLAVERCRAVIAFGEHGPEIANMVTHARRMGGRLSEVQLVENLESAVKTAAELAQSGDVVLLSPGCTSFDAYQDFAERGEHFRKLVNALRRSEP